MEKEIIDKLKNVNQINERLRAAYIGCVKIEYFLKTGKTFNLIFNENNEIEYSYTLNDTLLHT